MDTSTAVRQRILDLCRQRGITVNRLATIKKLCDGLDITLRDFFDAAVFEDLEQEIN